MPHHVARRKFRRAVLATLAATALAAGLAQVVPASAHSGDIRGLGAADAVPNSYLVVFKDAAVGKSAVPSTTRALATRYDATVTHRYSDAVRGFAATLTLARAHQLAANPAVAYVEQDRRVGIDAVQAPTPSWGLDRVDQRNLPLDSRYGYASDGSGVTAYIIDTGINLTHSDFTGRIRSGYDAVDRDSDATDCNGHGTHVAGTVAGTKYGVAKKSSLVAVRVLNCQGSGTFAGVVAGIDWVTRDHVSGPAVANMSLGGGADTTVDTAVRNSIADGVTYAIASGNSTANACNYSPARVTEAITVNASTKTDARASFSNYGTCTDIFAPGESITSDWIGSTSATNTISGTSMASPHVAGAAALYLAGHPGATPATVASALFAASTPNLVTNPGTGSPNRLLYALVTRPATLCSDINYGARCQVTETNIADLRGSTVGNDALSSVKVPSSEWLLLYADVNYAGACRAYSADRSDLRVAPTFNDVASSIRIAVEPGSCPLG